MNRIAFEQLLRLRPIRLSNWMDSWDVAQDIVAEAASQGLITESMLELLSSAIGQPLRTRLFPSATARVRFALQDALIVAGTITDHSAAPSLRELTELADDELFRDRFHMMLALRVCHR